MPKGYGLLVGLKSVDSKKYNGWDGINGCWGCELDVDNIEQILNTNGYNEIEILKTKNATSENILKKLEYFSKKIKPEDIFVFYYSGHGGQMPDNDGDELDGHDETLVAYDREIRDDELVKIWEIFSEDTRIFMISDSCNSGTNYKLIKNINDKTPIIPIDKTSSSKYKFSMIHYGGCRDGESSSGYKTGGAFTMALCDLWKSNGYKYDYKNFLNEISKNFKFSQNPQFSEFGKKNEKFLKQNPFVISDKDNIKINISITGNNFEDINDYIKNKLPKEVLEQIGNLSNNNRPCSVSGSTSTGPNGTTVSGTFTCTF